MLPCADGNRLDREVPGWRLRAQFDTQTVEDIFEMRLCFEPRASALAAQRAYADGLLTIERRVLERAHALERGSDAVSAAAAMGRLLGASRERMLTMVKHGSP